MSDFMILCSGASGPKFIVRGVRSDLVGIWHCEERDIIRPNDCDIAALIPYKWRKAFARSNGRFWYHDRARIEGGKIVGGDAPHLELRGYRGEYLTTLYAIPSQGKES